MHTTSFFMSLGIVAMLTIIALIAIFGAVTMSAIGTKRTCVRARNVRF